MGLGPALQNWPLLKVSNLNWRNPAHKGHRALGFPAHIQNRGRDLDLHLELCRLVIANTMWNRSSLTTLASKVRRWCSVRLLDFHAIGSQTQLHMWVYNCCLPLNLHTCNSHMKGVSGRPACSQAPEGQKALLSCMRQQPNPHTGATWKVDWVLPPQEVLDRANRV